MKIVFILAPYPTEETLKDGMVQRIAILDDLMKDCKKVYVNIALKNPVYKRIIHADTVEELFFNPFYPVNILSEFLLKADVIYAHSIYLFRFMPYCFFWLKKRKVNFILDAHGIVPEEVNMNGKPLMSRYFNWIESKVFRVLNHCISVSNEMIEHYKRKYPWSSVNYHLLFTGKLMPEPNLADVDNLASTHNIKPSDCVIVYCGNTQVWQNTQLMVETIKKISKKGIKFLILSGEAEKFAGMLTLTGVHLNNVIIKSVSHDELNMYYQLAHYGLILRDDIPINRVSNPTKMLEYLQFGLIPIVLSPYIGDYYSLGYEYIGLNEVENIDFKPKKSVKNAQIAFEIANRNSAFDVNNLIE